MGDEILKLAAALGGVAESDGLKALCQAAEAELTGLLREGVTAAKCGGAFPLAAAWLALAALEAGEGAEQFTAGAVTVRKRDGRERSAALRLQALQVMKPYIEDEGFLFQGVRG